MFPLLFPEPGQEHAEEMQENLQRAIEKAQKGEVPALIYAKEGADKVVLHLFDMARGLGLGGGLTSLYDYKFEITKNNIGRWQVDKRTTFSTQLVGAGTQKMYETIPTPPLVVTYTYKNGRLETSKRVGDFIRVSVEYNEAGEKIKEEIEDLPIPVE